ncbi:MAG: RNA methyltransferase [Calothrix sp. SM1_5_4]|nr:RNA methyltransferase [Calothrix sp. SM1_5_4]
MSSTGRASLNLALIHWPVFDSTKKVVCTNVTNFDIHDIARASRTYGVDRYFIVNRMREQLSFVSRVLDHWRVGSGAAYNPKRKTALGMVELAETLEDVLKKFERKPLLVCTTARDLPIPRVSFRELREKVWDPGSPPILLVFGTGFGLHDSILNQADLLLEPLKGASADDYRHLSVRSAVSIVLDRLLGAW